jgi:hypothetical protein
MKKTIIVIAMLCTAFYANAQFYISASGGYSIPSAGVRFGTETTNNGVENTYGSYGEGLHTQLRGGYFFNKSVGIEIGLGYLYGADQTTALIDVDGQPYVNLKARARAYGASASVVYNFTDNIYGRVGALIKVGGKTEAVGEIKELGLPANTLPGVAVPTTLDVDFTHDYKGKLPLGVITAVGYKYNVAKNIAVFGELEYMGISVTRDTSEMSKFSATLRETGTDLSIEQVQQILINSPLSSIAPIFNKNIEYVDSLPLGADPNGSKQLSQKVPYSSFGLNFGITYSFGDN